MKRSIVAVALSLFVALSFSAIAGAATFQLVGVEDPNLVANVDFNYNAGTGVVEVSITNDTSLAGGPDARLTAFAFNLPADVTVVGFSSSHAGWNAVFKPNGIDTPGLFGFYDVAAITGPNFNGGKPNVGIPPTETFTFMFMLGGTGLAAVVDEMDFLNQLSYSRPKPVENVQYFIGRFQRTGMDGEGSDVAIPSGAPSNGDGGTEEPPADVG